ncbi:hypothetical protein BB561_006810 [Smittium simulii]|uniref:Uncharacterized protein n=1 Tax=Smittium simulii TaxID=133385 RepID=A0A2T9Y198_9FUNG|nr:hypothetical protein BB561_006810 [Smittium simulii]
MKTLTVFVGLSAMLSISEAIPKEYRSPALPYSKNLYKRNTEQQNKTNIQNKTLPDCANIISIINNCFNSNSNTNKDKELEETKNSEKKYSKHSHNSNNNKKPNIATGENPDKNPNNIDGNSDPKNQAIGPDADIVFDVIGEI